MKLLFCWDFYSYKLPTALARRHLTDMGFKENVSLNDGTINKSKCGRCPFKQVLLFNNGIRSESHELSTYRV
jgi:hypothetical protein